MESYAGAERSKAEQETLYLIYKYLESIPSCKGASVKLKDELQHNFLLGDIYSWDGSRKNADINDMDRKYTKVPSDKLLSLLRKSGNVENSTLHSSSIITSSAQRPSVDDLLNYHSMLTQLATISINQSEHRSGIVKTKAKLEKVTQLIEQQKIHDEALSGEETAAFMANLTAKDYEEIYAHDSSPATTVSVLAPSAPGPQQKV